MGEIKTARGEIICRIFQTNQGFLLHKIVSK